MVGIEKGWVVLGEVNWVKGLVVELDGMVLVKLEDEFGCCGGWLRVYLVIDGYVYSFMYCLLCNWGEFLICFFWMIDYFGKIYVEIVEVVGEWVCIFCYLDVLVVCWDKDKMVVVFKLVMLIFEEIE